LEYPRSRRFRGSERIINANPTLETLVRIARAIGGELEFGFRGAA
jgi:hypothetical protein